MTEQATVAQVIDELDQLGLYAEPIRTTPDERAGLNVFKDGERYPAASVWVPKGEEGWIWGPSYQWGAYADDDAQTVAEKISRTIPE